MANHVRRGNLDDRRARRGFAQAVGSYGRFHSTRNACDKRTSVPEERKKILFRCSRIRVFRHRTVRDIALVLDMLPIACVKKSPAEFSRSAVNGRWHRQIQAETIIDRRIFADARNREVQSSVTRQQKTKGQGPFFGFRQRPTTIDITETAYVLKTIGRF